MNRSRFAVTFAVLSVARVALAADPFSENIRPTAPLTPQQEAKAFHLPPGFEISLVASEPDIGKPMNIAFDAKGRLWVSSTTEYPFPSPINKPGKDTLKVISFNEDGSTKSVDTFAEGFNIPVGVMPYKDGAIAFSIPAISFYRDTDGDGKADKVEKLYGDFGYEKDTHGMSSNYLRGMDGWIYGCHGFSNTSTVKGADGKPITMFSGNTYRFRPDGSHIEIFTHGQTNPFGLCQDPLGNIYSADSHSKPIYSLLRGGYYESLHPFHDGLGFAPPMMHHLHGSTAIASVIYYAAEQFPPAFRDNMFVGNVVTSRVNRDSLSYTGSSPHAQEEPDLVTTDDPWFRPNQIKLGPDGALYVSDFYNRIIGHYEVPLDHPQRDYTRGRIWRITYKGSEPHSPPNPIPDFTKASVRDLVGVLNHPNLTVRCFATDQLVDRIGQPAVEPLTALLKGFPTPFEGRHALWALYRLGALDKSTTLADAANLPDAGTRVQVMRILSEMPTWDSTQWGVATVALKDSDPFVRRAAADAMARRPNPSNIRPLLDLLSRTSPADTHLTYVISMALRDQLKTTDAFKTVEQLKLTDAETRTIAELCMAVPTPESAAWLTRHIEQVSDRGDTSRALRHAAQYIAGPEIDSLVDVARTRFASDLDFQLDLLNSLREGLVQRGTPPTPALRNWAIELAQRTLRAVNVDTGWANVPYPDAPTGNPWTYQDRACADGVTARLLSSLPRGEQLTGILRSRPFPIPPSLSFYFAGHTGAPTERSNLRNRIRLVTADTHEVLAESFPPRSDVAALVNWQLGPFAGRQGFIEVVDGDTGGAYAWVAFGRLEPAVVPMPPASPSDAQRRQQDACAVAGAFKLTELAPDLSALLSNPESTADTRTAAATALAACGSDAGVPLLTQIVADPGQPQSLREQIAASLAPTAGTSDQARAALVSAFRGAPNGLQVRLATSLSSTPAGAAAFLDAVAQGSAPAALLFNPAISERLAAANVPDLETRLKQLTRGLPPPDEHVRQTIAERVGAYGFLRPNPYRGANVFAKNCQVCHSIDGHGQVVGPQLDGIGNRGLDRLVEDILDPNRNVDPAFRYSNVFLNDGTVVTGLQRRDDGGTLTFTDSTGKEVTLAKDQIKKRTESRPSLMPSNFADALPPGDFYDLVAFLLAHKPK